MRNVKITRTVKLAMTAADWQLYTSMEGAADAARSLNRTVEDAINSSATHEAAAAKCSKALNALSNFGASDTEPRWVLHDLLEHVYGEEK